MKRRRPESTLPPLPSLPLDVVKLLARNDILNQKYNVFTTKIMWPTSPSWRKKFTLLSLLFNINKWLLVAKDFAYLKDNSFVQDIYGYSHGLHEDNSISLYLRITPKPKKEYLRKNYLSGETEMRFSKTRTKVTKKRKDWWQSCKNEIAGTTSIFMGSDYNKYKQKSKMPNEKRFDIIVERIKELQKDKVGKEEEDETEKDDISDSDNKKDPPSW